MIYPIYTATQGVISEGAAIEVFTSQNADYSIPVITVGQTGRGRDLGVLPVGHVSLDEVQNGSIQTITAAAIGRTKSGKPKLFAADSPDTRDKAITVFRTPIGFRGSNDHTGDINGWECHGHGCDAEGPERPNPKACPKCGAANASSVPWGHGITTRFAEFPGERIISGCIAQGDAGYMGSGEQLVAIMPAGIVFRTHYSGRMYGEPTSHYMEFTGEKIVSMTYKERGLVGLPSDNYQ